MCFDYGYLVEKRKDFFLSLCSFLSFLSVNRGSSLDLCLQSIQDEEEGFEVDLGVLSLAIALGEFLPDACPLLYADHPEVPLLQLFRELFEATVGCHCQLLEEW